MAAVQLPNGKQQFMSGNGSPLVGGTVGMYFLNTLIPQNTWQDAAQTILNTNPIILDANGSALIYGTGTYRQIVKDSVGNTIWDEPVYSNGGTGAGGVVSTITHAQSPYTLKSTDGTLFCDVSGGAITINLLAATAYGSVLSIKIKGVATNQVIVVPHGTDSIDGGSSYVLSFSGQSVSLVSDLTSYWGLI